nr:hypothetical protein [Pandoravirus aubagnensis]
MVRAAGCGTHTLARLNPSASTHEYRALFRVRPLCVRTRPDLFCSFPRQCFFFHRRAQPAHRRARIQGHFSRPETVFVCTYTHKHPFSPCASFLSLPPRNFTIDIAKKDKNVRVFQKSPFLYFQCNTKA